MENTNSTPTPQTNIQSFENPSIPTPKPNLFKYFFFISLFVLLAVIISFLIILNNKKNNQISTKSNDISQTTPTIKPTESVDQTTPVASLNQGSYQAKSVDDSQNKIIKLILKDNLNNETLVDSAEYWQTPGGETVKPGFTNLEISSTNKYLLYFLSNGYEGGTSFLYNIKAHQKIRLNNYSETHGYDKNEQYFYSCSSAGLDDGGAVIYSLPSMKLAYQAPGICYKCQLNSNNNIEIIEHESCVSINPKKIEFFTETGKIKQ